MFAEETDEVSVGIEDFHAIVKGVGNVDIPVAVHRYALRRSKVAGSGEEMVLAAGSDAPQLFERVGIIDNYLVLLGVNEIQEAIRRIDCAANRILEPFRALVLDLVFGIKDQDAMHLAVGDKKPVVIIDGEAVDPAKMGFV